MSKPLRVNKPERGASIVMFTVLIAFVLIPIMGLGIDATIQYYVKAKLSSAVDSAALSAARSLSVGSTITAQTSNAQMVGRQYFLANFPAGIMRTTVFGGAQVSNNASITVTPVSNYITVTASAQVRVPTYFMSFLGMPTGTIAASSQTTRRNSNVVLVLDRSGSMNNASNSCSALIGVVQEFSSQFVEGRDQMELITFSSSAHVDFGPGYTFKSALSSAVASMVCVGATSSAQGLSLAYSEIQTINQPGALNVIVFFTDGQANAVNARYPIKSSADTRYDYVNTGNLIPFAKSTCNTSDVLDGGYTDFSHSDNSTGSTGGVYDVTPTSISGGSAYPPVINAPGCTFTRSGYYGSYNVYDGRADVAYIPSPDDYGNLTTGYKASDTYPSGPYAGKIRADTPAGIRYAAMNAADNKAQQIRADSLYKIVTYSVGLSGNEPIPMDTDFLERIANDPNASNYDPTQPQGQFILCANNSCLADAFNSIASQILRLSK